RSRRSRPRTTPARTGSSDETKGPPPTNSPPSRTPHPGRNSDLPRRLRNYRLNRMAIRGLGVRPNRGLPPTIKRRLSAGELPNAYKTSSGQWRIPVTDLIAAGYDPGKVEWSDPEQPTGEEDDNNPTHDHQGPSDPRGQSG